MSHFMFMELHGQGDVPDFGKSFGLCGDTAMLQNDIHIDAADLEEDLALDFLDAGTITELEMEALRQVSIAAGTANITTSATKSPPLSMIQSGSVVAQTAMHASALFEPSVSNTVMWLLVIAVAIVGLGCIFCMVRGVERTSVNPPPHAGATKKKGGRSRPGSASSLGGQYQKQVPGSAASLRSARSGFSSVSRSARDSRAGRLLSARVRGRDGSVGPQPASARRNQPPGEWPKGTPATVMTKQFTFSTEQARGSGVLSSQKPRKTGQADASQADCRFTVPVDTLVEVAEEGSFNLTDIASGLTLKVTLCRDTEGHRVLQIFSGQAGERPVTSVGPPKQGSRSDPDSLDLCGPNGNVIANLTLQGNGSFLVSSQGQPVLVIEGNEADLDLRISSRDGRLVGAVSCNDANFSGVEHVEFCVLPGTDPVLVVSSILAVLFLCGDDEDTEGGD